MKKLIYLLLAIVVVACMKDEFEDPWGVNVDDRLEIADIEGLAFQGSEIRDGSLFNLKTLTAGDYTLEVRNRFNNVVSKSVIKAVEGDNVNEFYTRAFSDGDYTIIVYYAGEELYNVKYTIL